MFRKVIIVAMMISLSVAGNVKIDFNVRQDETNFHTKGAIKFAKLVYKYSKGTISIKVHPGSKLVNGSPLKAVKDGTVAMTDMIMQFTVDGGKVFGISALPFVASDYDDAFKLY